MALKAKQIEKGTSVKTPDGVVAKVVAVRKLETGKRGRPALLFQVNGAEYRAKELQAAG